MDGTSDTGGEFSLLFPALIDGQLVRTARASDPAGVLSCAMAGTFDPVTLDLNTAAGYTNPACYPLTQVVYMQVPHDYPVNESTVGFAILSALSSLNTQGIGIDGWFNDSMFVRAAQLPFLSAANIAALQSVTSGGDTLLVAITCDLASFQVGAVQRVRHRVAGRCLHAAHACRLSVVQPGTRGCAPSSPLLMSHVSDRHHVQCTWPSSCSCCPPRPAAAAGSVG